MKRIAVAILAIIALSGCATPANYKLNKFGDVNIVDKSITVPSVGNGLFEIKDALRKDKWKIKVDNATVKETGVRNDIIDSESKVKFDTAYRLYMVSTISTNENYGITTFSLTIVDNKTNEEVINMAGDRADYVRYDPNEIARRLVNVLNNSDSK